MYQSINQNDWSGRTDSETLRSAFRFHQIISTINMKKNTIQPEQRYNNQVNMALIGFECDEGVSRNKGRSGAVDGPKHFRKALSSLPVHNDHLNLTDYGNVVCNKTKLEEAQEELRNATGTDNSNIHVEELNAAELERTSSVDEAEEAKRVASESSGPVPDVQTDPYEEMRKRNECIVM